MKICDDGEEEDREILKQSAGVGMPFFYRTPDLVAYAKNQFLITPKSDVFQLGLVLAHMFSGWNPLKASRDMLAPLEIDEIRPVASDFGSTIQQLIGDMLEENPDSRPAAADLIDLWDGLFRRVVDHSHGLEGRVF